jgi:hypothetical protein
MKPPSVRSADEPLDDPEFWRAIVDRLGSPNLFREIIVPEGTGPQYARPIRAETRASITPDGLPFRCNATK